MSKVFMKIFRKYSRWHRLWLWMFPTRIATEAIEYYPWERIEPIETFRYKKVFGTWWIVK